MRSAQVRFLLDEDTEKSLADKLQNGGHDVERVVTTTALGSGSDDRDVLEYAHQNDRLIITHDDGFLSFDPGSHAGIFYGPK